MVLNTSRLDAAVRLWHGQPMPKRSSKDVNQLAAEILKTVTGESASSKNPAAVALGRLGGLSGGRARADALTPAKRAQIAKKAAQARWKSKKA